MNKDSSYIETILEEYGEFIPVPVELLVNPRYNGKGDGNRLSHSSAILYGVLLYLAKKESKNDENDNPYVIITGNEIATIVGTTTSSTPTNMINQLVKFDLIERSPFIHGQPYKLLIKEITR